MRPMLLGVLTVSLLAGLADRAAGQDDPKEVIKKAIAAQGGAEKLEKYQGTRSSAKGTISLMGLELEFTIDTVAQLPDKQKSTINLEVMGQAVSVVQMVNGDKMSMSVNGMDMPVPDDQKEEMKRGIAVQRISVLTPLLKDGGYELKSIAGEKINGKDTNGVLVNGNGLKDVKLYFEKDSGLMVRVVRMGSDPMGGGEVVQEMTLSDYKEVQGVKRAMKSVMTSDGNKFMESTTTKIELFEKIDDKEFAD